MVIAIGRDFHCFCELSAVVFVDHFVENKSSHVQDSIFQSNKVSMFS